MGYICSKCMKPKIDDDPVTENVDTIKKQNTALTYTKSPSPSRSLTLENNSMRMARVDNKNYFNYGSAQRLSHLEYESYSKNHIF